MDSSSLIRSEETIAIEFEVGASLAEDALRALAGPKGEVVSAGADGATASPFTMLPGAAGAMVCEGDVCYVPGVASDVE